ncbi:MAG: hypothetical protein KDB68_07675 [Planctomycetes bacterium]|nr:hypothetical protein [Planctomycetota bacterium]
MKKKLLLLLLVLIALVISLYLFHEPAGEPSPAETQEGEPTLLGTLQLAAQQPTDDVQQGFEDYRLCVEQIPAEGFEELRPLLARRLAAAAQDHGTADEIADAGILLHDDGFQDIAHPLLVLAETKLEAVFPTLTRVADGPDASQRRGPPQIHKKYVEVVKRLGWQEWHEPAELNDWQLYEVEGWQAYRDYVWDSVPQKCRDVGLYPPATIRELDKLLEVIRGNWTKLKNEDHAAGFALKARAAWLRFKQSQDSRGKVMRNRGKRSFSPKAMGREAQAFTDIWTYQYSRPFIVYIEKPFDAELNQAHLNDALGMLADLYDWFIDQFVDEMDLKRVRPQFHAELAEQEAWPIEIVLFASREQFDRFVEESTGSELPGMTATYAPGDERVVACLPQGDEDMAWYQSRIAKAAFQLLSDFYAPDPTFDEDEQMRRPRWSSLLVQEGLAECVASYAKTGQWPNTEHEFMALSPYRVASYVKTVELLEGRPLFRIRDLLEVRSYGQANQIAFKRAQELKVDAMWASQNGIGMFFPAACMACYFFHHYQRDNEYVYRDIWWGFLHAEYNGKHKLTSFSDAAGIEGFKAAFGITSDSDWADLQREFEAFVEGLAPEVTEPDEND